MPQFAELIRVPVVKKSPPKPIAARPEARIPPGPQAALRHVIQRKAEKAAEATAPSPGAPSRSSLPQRLKAGVERLSGLFMDDVRVHRDSPEPAKLGALAYTQGGDIHLGPGQERHLPHEAWHVVQQKQGRVQATTQMKGLAVNQDAGLEAEADRMADAVLGSAAASGEALRPPAVQAVPSSAFSSKLGGMGTPMSAATLAYFEPRFGRDLSGVRVHTDRQAANSADGLGANAIASGSHIAFAPGEYAPQTASGRKLMAHELAHVVRHGDAGTIFRQEKKKPSLEDSESALGNILRGPAHAAGFKLAFYLPDAKEKEFERRATDFAKRESTLGFTGDTPAADTIKVGHAIAGVSDIDDRITAITAVAAAALARVPAPPDQPAAAAAAPGKVKTIAIFAHGGPTRASGGLSVNTAGPIFKAIAPNLAGNATVIFYTCNSARGTDQRQDWVKGTMEGGGTGSLVEKVRDTLVDEKVEGATVWGHTTTGHTSYNPALRTFDVSAGKGAAGESYVSKYVFTDTEHTIATKEIATTIREFGYTVDDADGKFIAAAATVLRDKFYKAYIKANAKLEGDKVAEDAPNYPYLTAARVWKYWTDVYWPGERAKAAKAVIAALKLQKAAVAPK